MAINPLYQNELAKMLQGGFQNTPGYQFARDQGLEAAQRSMSSQRGSGNVLAELTRLGSGYAAQDYGNQVDRLGRLVGQEQQYGLGQEANANQATNIANQYSLGQTQNANTLSLGNAQNANTAQRNAWDYNLGQEQNRNTRSANNQQFGLGMYNAGNTAQRNAWDFQLGQGQNQANMLNANTNWFTAQSNDRNNTGRTNQDWWRLINQPGA